MKKSATTIVIRPALVCLLVFCGNSFGLGLGEIEVTSFLNDPLEASIELTGPVDPTEGDLIIKLASPEVFQRMGVPHDYSLSRLKFSHDLTASPPTISISSQSPIREPLLVFVLEVQWPKGQMVREYRVFLNPTP